jgi:biopolymer transport protein ExbB/TolQ
MLNLIQMSGHFGWVLVIIALVVLIHVVRAVWRLSNRSAEPGPAWENNLNGILFWGAFAAVFGFLGQCFGIYEAMTAISRATEISPTVTALGFLISFTSTLIGLSICVIAALCWYTLRLWSNRVVTA